MHESHLPEYIALDASLELCLQRHAGAIEIHNSYTDDNPITRATVDAVASGLMVVTDYSLEGVKEFVSDVWEGIKNIFNKIWESIKNFLRWLRDGLNKLIGRADLVEEKAKKVNEKAVVKLEGGFVVDEEKLKAMEKAFGDFVGDVLVEVDKAAERIKESKTVEDVEKASEAYNNRLAPYMKNGVPLFDGTTITFEMRPGADKKTLTPIKTTTTVAPKKESKQDKATRAVVLRKVVAIKNALDAKAKGKMLDVKEKQRVFETLDLAMQHSKMVGLTSETKQSIATAVTVLSNHLRNFTSVDVKGEKEFTEYVSKGLTQLETIVNQLAKESKE